MSGERTGQAITSAGGLRLLRGAKATAAYGADPMQALAADRSRRFAGYYGALLASYLWLMLVVVGLACRPPMPIDETRYLAVAWEMWCSGDQLVPHLLAQAYAHKPPLLFWTIEAGWWLFGVSEWWARLVAPLFGLGCMALSMRLARQLWPDEPRVAQLAPLLLLGGSFWAVFTTLTMFDTLVTFFALLGASSLIAVWRGFGERGWGGLANLALCALAIGLGILAKGPVVLLHLAPLILFAPWLLRGGGHGPRPTHWYLGVGLSVAGGIAIALAWAIPAALHGGPAYAHAIFWGQTAERIADVGGDLNPHRHAWWWYLPFLPALLFPWSCWPPAWRAWTRLRAVWAEAGVRLCVLWIVSMLVVFSLVAGKQIHYLVPLLPVAALLLARLLTLDDAPWRRRDQVWPALVPLLIGVVLLVGPHLDPRLLHLLELHNREAAPNAWAAGVTWLPGLAVLALGAAMIALPAAHLALRVVDLSLACTAMVLVIHVGAADAARPAFDLHPLATRIHAWQDAGIEVARVSPYHAEYQFLGRLEHPVREVEPTAIRAWAESHQPGELIMQFSERHPPPAWLGAPDETLLYRGMNLGLWSAARVASLPPANEPAIPTPPTR